MNSSRKAIDPVIIYYLFSKGFPDKNHISEDKRRSKRRASLPWPWASCRPQGPKTARSKIAIEDRFVLAPFWPPPCHPAWLHSSPFYSPAGFSYPLLTHTMSATQQMLTPRVTAMGTPQVLFHHSGSQSQGRRHLPEPPRSTALRSSCGSLLHLILLRNHETTDTFSLAEEAWCGFMQIPLQCRSTRQNILKSAFQNHRWAGREAAELRPRGQAPGITPFAGSSSSSPDAASNFLL